MNTDTPETDAMVEQCQREINVPTNAIPAEFARKIERERDEWKAKFIQQNKDLGCEQMDPNGTIWDYAKKVQSEILTVTKERDEAREQRDMLAEALREMWPFIEEDDLGSMNTPAFGAAIHKYKQALAELAKDIS